MRLHKAKIVGKNTLPKNFRLLISGPTGSGKTTWVEKLIKSKRIKHKFKHIYYCYPDHFEEPPVNWDSWEDTIITFVPFLPDIEYIKSIKENSLLVLDDNFEEAIKSPVIAQALKIHSRRNFSVILITQSFFEHGPFSRTIRNQLNAVILYRNFADYQINRRIAKQLGVLDQFTQAEKNTKDCKYDPIVILSNEIVAQPEMRVQTNFLSDTVSFCYY